MNKKECNKRGGIVLKKEKTALPFREALFLWRAFEPFFITGFLLFKKSGFFGPNRNTPRRISSFKDRQPFNSSCVLQCSNAYFFL